MRGPDRRPPAAVVLVPGLWMPAWSLLYLAQGLRRCGFVVYRFGYSSVRADLAANAASLRRFILERCERRPVHLVGHSLGGLVIRSLLHAYPELPVARVVTLATPHQDSAVARRLAACALGRALLGRSVQDLLAGRLPPDGGRPRCPIGVIRGDLAFGLGRLLYPKLPRPNDGLLSATETRLPGADDEITLPVTHTGMLVSRRVVAQICQFLARGCFHTAACGADKNF